MVAATGSTELFVATALFVIIGTGVAAALAGVSMALGGFIAGLVLAETEFRKAIETTIAPFKGLLLGLFFFTVGMNIDLRELARDPFWLFRVGRRTDRHQGCFADRPVPPVSPVLADQHRNRTAARSRRRIRFRQHRHGDRVSA